MDHPTACHHDGLRLVALAGQVTRRTVMSHFTHAQPILVIGSSGKTGRRVAERVTDRGIPVRHGSRQAEPPFDWQDAQTWAPALQGVRAVYLTYAPDLAVPGAV